MYRSNKKITLIQRHTLPIVLGVSVVLIILAGFVYMNYKKAKDPRAEMLKTKNQLSKLVILPENEDPTLATVTDKSKLSGGIYENATNGDKLLLFYKAKKAYLYRPSNNRLVDIGPIVIDPSVQEVANTKIMVRNGSNDQVKTDAIRSKIAEYYKTAQVIPADQAGARGDYPQTIVIDLTAGNEKYNLVTNLAESLNAKRGVLPSGEQAPANTDVLIITGVKN